MKRLFDERARELIPLTPGVKAHIYDSLTGSWGGGMGTILQPRDNRHSYEVTMENGNVSVRNRIHLRPCEAQGEDEREEEV